MNLYLRAGFLLFDLCFYIKKHFDSSKLCKRTYTSTTLYEYCILEKFTVYTYK